MDQIKIGAFIAALRKEHGLTQRQLAEELGISDKTVSKWETGKGLPEVSLMLPLCQRLGISVNELLSGERLEQESYEQRAEENMLNLMIDSKKKELKTLKSRCSAYTVLLFIGMFLHYMPFEYSHGFAKLLCYLGMLGSAAFFVLAIWMYNKKQISGLFCFLQLVFWPWVCLLCYILTVFIDASFTGTGRYF